MESTPDAKIRASWQVVLPYCFMGWGTQVTGEGFIGGCCAVMRHLSKLAEQEMFTFVSS